MMYRFKVKHIPGKDHVIPDAFSRRQDSPIAQTAPSSGNSRHTSDPSAGWRRHISDPPAGNGRHISDPSAGWRRHISDPPADMDASMSNVLPGYSDSLGPPSWVSTPTVSALTLAPTAEEIQDTTRIDEFLTGIILATITEVNQHSLLTPLTSPTQPTVLSWARLEAACLSCPDYNLLRKAVQSGVSDTKEDWDVQILDFFPQRHSLVAVGPVVMLHDRPVIPRSLQQNVLEHLHAGHASATSMFERAATSLYWPNLRADMINFRAACTTCTRYAPSNPAMPPTEPEHPTYPFQSICADFFHISPNNYLAIVDRYSNWLSIFQLPTDNSEEIVNVLRNYIAIFGIPCTLTSDGASVFTSKLMEGFCDRWGIVHRVATAYHPRANKRAEVGVKSAKRLVRGNLSQTGSLHTDKLARALLAHRNSPCPVTGLSPAQIVFGRVLRDFLPLQPGKFQPRPEWRQAASAREAAYAKRHIKKAEQLSRGTKPLPPLQPGDHVAVQNQTGINPRQWSQTGVVIEVGPHHSYHISIDGSRTVTKRNRQYLRKIVPFHDTLPTPLHNHVPLKPTPVHNQTKPVHVPNTPPAATQDQHIVPDNDVPEDDHVLQTQVEQSEDKDAVDSSAPSPTPSKPRLPPRLRERWIVAHKPPEQVPAYGTIAPVQYSPTMTMTYPYHSMQQNVATTYPNVLPYMMPQQHNFMMNQYPMMYQYSPYK